MTNGLIIKKTEGQNKAKKVCVDYEEYFDRNTGEVDSFSAEFELRKYLKGIRELKEKGSCCIDGRYGSISIVGKNLPCLTMSSNHESISIPVNLEELSLR